MFVCVRVCVLVCVYRKIIMYLTFNIKPINKHDPGLLQLNKKYRFVPGSTKYFIIIVLYKYYHPNVPRLSTTKHTTDAICII